MIFSSNIEEKYLISVYMEFDLLILSIKVS